MKGLIWAIVAVVAVAAIFTGIWLANRPATQEGAKTITFVINGKDASRSVEIHTDREYLGEALTDEKLVEGTESEYGLFVTTCGRLRAGVVVLLQGRRGSFHRCRHHAHRRRRHL